MSPSTLTRSLLLAGLFTSLAAHAEMVLRRGNGAEPQSLDPHIVEGVPGSHVLRDLYEGLTAEDAGANIIPGVAEKWDIAEDGKKITFHLRKTNWSDGTPLTAHDFVYGWQRAVDPAVGSKYSFILFPVKNAEKINTGEIKDIKELGVKAVDDHTLEVELENPTPYFIAMLAHSTASPAPKHVIEKHGKEWTRPENFVGNGAFKMESWQPNASIVVVKSDQYWNKDSVKLDKVIFYPTEDQGSELKRYRADELDWTYEIPNDQIKWLRENLKDELVIGPYLGTYYYGFNLSQPPFKDNPKLAKALSLAIDRNVITEKVTGVGEVPAYGIVPPGIAGYENYVPEYASLNQQERNEMAKKLYEEAGYGKDKPLKIDIMYNTNENHKKIAVAISAMWKQVLGVETTLTNQEWKVYLQTRKEKKATQVFRAGWIGDYPDAFTFLDMFQSTSGLNDVAYASEKYDALIKQSAAEQDPAKRAAILKETEQTFIEDYALAPVYHYVTKRLVKPHVKGYTPNVMDHVRSQYLWIEK